MIFLHWLKRSEQQTPLLWGDIRPMALLMALPSPFLKDCFLCGIKMVLTGASLPLLWPQALAGELQGSKRQAKQIEHALTMEGMEILGNLKAIGNTECMVCGYGQNMSHEFAALGNLEMTPQSPRINFVKLKTNPRFGRKPISWAWKLLKKIKKTGFDVI